MAYKALMHVGPLEVCRLSTLVLATLNIFQLFKHTSPSLVSIGVPQKAKAASHLTICLQKLTVQQVFNIC